MNDSELNLINELHKYEKELSYVELDMQFAENIEDLEKFRNKQNTLFNKISDLKVKLASSDNQNLANDIYNSLIKLFTVMLDEVNKIKTGYYISLKQGKSYEYSILSVFLINVNSIFASNIKINPPFFNITPELKYGLPINLVLNFISSELSILSSIQPVNYLNLRTYYNEFSIRLEDVFGNFE